jgi:hypothetical protein
LCPQPFPMAQSYDTHRAARPNHRERGWASRRPQARGALEALARRADDKLLLVLDQVEEFVILAGSERQQTFIALMALPRPNIADLSGEGPADILWRRSLKDRLAPPLIDEECVATFSPIAESGSYPGGAKRGAEIALCRRPIERSPLAREFHKRCAIGQNRFLEPRRAARPLAERAKRCAKIILGHASIVGSDKSQ